MVRDEAPQRGHEPAAAAPGDALAASSRVNETGPRFETTISLRRAAIGREPSPYEAVPTVTQRGLTQVVAVEPVEERQPVTKEPRHQEALADVLLPATARGAPPSPGRRGSPGTPSAHCSTESTSQPVSPSRIWATMPPARPATVGRPFQSASVTVSPKPSRIDFWITAFEWTWKALTSTEPMLFRFDRMKMSGSPAAWATVRL